MIGNIINETHAPNHLFAHILIYSYHVKQDSKTVDNNVVYLTIHLTCDNTLHKYSGALQRISQLFRVFFEECKEIRLGPYKVFSK